MLRLPMNVCLSIAADRRRPSPSKLNQMWGVVSGNRDLGALCLPGSSIGDVSCQFPGHNADGYISMIAVDLRRWPAGSREMLHLVPALDVRIRWSSTTAAVGLWSSFSSPERVDPPHRGKSPCKMTGARTRHARFWSVMWRHRRGKVINGKPVTPPVHIITSYRPVT